MANQKALTSEQAILSRFQELRNEISSMGAKANEMAAESQEHELVLKALEPLDGGRRCYRMVRALILLIHHVRKIILMRSSHGYRHQTHWARVCNMHREADIVGNLRDTRWRQ